MARTIDPGRTKGTWRWRAAAVAFVAVAASGLAAGIAYGFFTSTGTGTGSASVGAVSMGANDSLSKPCSFPMLSPGDLTKAATCALSVDYTGTIPAYVSLTVAIESGSGPGVNLLYDGSNSTGLTFSISDGYNTYSVPTGAGTTGGSCPGGFTCWSAPNDLAAWYSGATPNLTFTNGTSVTWTVTPSFPAATVGNAYQGGTANLVLTAQAASAGTPLPAICTTSSIGQSCPASGSFAWN